MAKVITGGNLEIDPIALEALYELEIVKEINEHSSLHFKGVVEEDKNKYIHLRDTQKELEVNKVDDAGTEILFKGKISNLKIKAVRDIYHIEVEAVSYISDLDLKLKKRSFQDQKMTYKQLLKEVIADYPGGDVMDKASQGAQIEKFILQYRETDWQFLKRLASHFNTGLIPDDKFAKPKFYFGVPKKASKGKLKNFNYRVKKRLGDYRFSFENYIEDLKETDFTYYEVQTNQILNVGDKVKFKNNPLYVSKVVAKLKDGLLKHICSVAPKKGLAQNTIYNEKLVGLSLQGKVID